MNSRIIKSKEEVNRWINDYIRLSQNLLDSNNILVDNILENVKKNGDDALISLTRKFDNIKLKKSSLYFFISKFSFSEFVLRMCYMYSEFFRGVTCIHMLLLLSTKVSCKVITKSG